MNETRAILLILAGAWGWITFTKLRHYWRWRSEYRRRQQKRWG